jgi:hypothetical protein
MNIDDSRVITRFQRLITEMLVEKRLGQRRPELTDEVYQTWREVEQRGLKDSRVPKCAVEGRSARFVACRIGQAGRAGYLFTRNRAHRHVGCPPKSRLVKPVPALPSPLAAAPAASGFIPDDRRASAHVSDALLGCFLGWRFWLCRKLKHRCLLTLA